MDPNLSKIKEDNIRLIYKGKLAQPIIHAKSYLLYILGEENYSQIELELNEFIRNIRSLISEENIQN